MANVRRLDAAFHFEEAHIRAEFDIEDARGKPNGRKALSELTQHEHLAQASEKYYLAKTRRGESRKGGR
jgi:hypothetical protein